MRVAVFLLVLALAFNDASRTDGGVTETARVAAFRAHPVPPIHIAEQSYPAHAERVAIDAEHVVRRRVSRPVMIRLAQARVIGGLSRSRFRALIQRSIRPRVRACFSRERAGNPHWFGRATLVLTLQGSTLASAHVETESESLRACILEGVPYLAIPMLEEAAEASRTVAYFPFVSPSYQRLPTPRLEAATSALLDAVFREEAGASPLALLQPESGVVQSVL